VGLLSLLFSFNGRVNRAQYWLGTIGVNVVNWIVMIATSTATSLTAAGHSQNAGAALAALSSQMAIVMPISLAVSWAALALQVKRFHDRGQSGWWTVLPLVPCIFMVMNVFSAVLEQWPPERLLSSLGMPLLALVIISIGFFVNLGCLAGTDGQNKYGNPAGSGGAFTPAPSAPKNRQTTPAGGLAFLGGADAAMQRAIAEQAKARPAQQPARQAPAGASARMAMAPAAAPSGFGRKPAR
jgi:uncharacterized membrane protein YhaH (DUF805 family)